MRGRPSSSCSFSPRSPSTAFASRSRASRSSPARGWTIEGTRPVQRGGDMNGYRWFRLGDLNAFFALMFDNVANLVILAAILVGAFHFPKEVVLYRMVPGTAVGVLVGDLIYAWMARRLARRSGREDVTAMPLGLNAPSVFGISFAVLGPAYLATGDALLTWKMGMAVTALVGIFKMALSMSGNAVRSA